MIAILILYAHKAEISPNLAMLLFQKNQTKMFILKGRKSIY